MVDGEDGEEGMLVSSSNLAVSHKQQNPQLSKSIEDLSFLGLQSGQCVGVPVTRLVEIRKRVKGYYCIAYRDKHNV